MIAYAYAEPAGLGWLGAKQSENSRTVYARDIGITPQRRASRADLAAATPRGFEEPADWLTPLPF